MRPATKRTELSASSLDQNSRDLMPCRDAHARLSDGPMKNRIMSILRIVRHFLRNRGKYTAAARVSHLRAYGSEIIVGGRLFSNEPISSAELVCRKFRESPEAVTTLRLQTVGWLRSPTSFLLRAICGVRVYRISGKIADVWHELPPSLYNFSVRCDGKPGTLQCIRDEVIFCTPNDRTVVLGYDPVAKTLRAEIMSFGASELARLREHGRSAATSDSVTVLVGEYSFSARDNGRAFFDSARPGGVDHTPELNPVYVIEAGALEREGLRPGPDVVAFGTVEHIEKCLEARAVAFSHDLRNVFPRIVNEIAPSHYSEIKTLFLQHGVTALKRSVQRVYHRSRTRISAVNVCSSWEADIFTRFFGFKDGRAMVAGFPRHDNLWRTHRESPLPDPNRILVFPTWRRDLNMQTKEAVRDSNFVRQWTNAIAELSKQGFAVSLMLHPIIAHLEALFEGVPDEIVPVSQFQETLLRSSAFITDYSSTCFEALYVQRPVFFFMFDAKEYGFEGTTFLDIDTELPGVRCVDSTALVEAVVRSRASNWHSNADHHRKMFFDNADDQNSRRVQQALLNLVDGYGCSSSSG